MPRWKVQLLGNTESIECAREALPEDYRIVSDDSGHHLQGQPLEQLGSSEEVGKMAASLVKLLNAAIAHSCGRSELRLNMIREFDAAGNRLSSIAYAESNVVLNLSVTAQADGPSPRSAKLLLRQLRRDPDVLDAYEHLQEDAYELEKACEVIRCNVQDNSGQGFLDVAISNLWTTEAEYERFRGSINSPEVLGKNARHARSGQAPPNDPMTLAKALAYARRLFDCWVEWLDSL